MMPGCGSCRPAPAATRPCCSRHGGSGPSATGSSAWCWRRTSRRSGCRDTRIGVVVTATLLGSAALTLAVGLRGHAIGRRRLLRYVSLLMIATGLGFAAFTNFWPLLIVGLVGTMNPSAGDVSVFLPTEQALLPGTAPDEQRTALFARYSLIGTLVAAVGALCAGVPEWIGARVGASTDDRAALGVRRLRACSAWSCCCATGG